MSLGALRHRVERGEWVGVGWGAYARSAAGIDHQGRIAHIERAVAACLRRPGVALAGATAAVAHGLPLVSRLPDDVQLLRPAGGTSHGGRRRGVNVRRAIVRDADIVMVGGVAATSVARTILDLACASREDGLAAADAALRAELVEPQQLLDALAGRLAGERGVRRARWVVAEASGLRESPLESWSWCRFTDWRLPLPAMQGEILDDVGRFLARVDFVWQHARVIGEADGRLKYVTAEDLYREKRREDALRDRGWTVVRWSWSDLASGAALRTRLASVLTER